MQTKSVELELDVLQKLEAAKSRPEESYSEVLRRAHFPAGPMTGRDLLHDLQERQGFSALNDTTLERLAENQRNPVWSGVHWDE